MPWGGEVGDRRLGWGSPGLMGDHRAKKRSEIYLDKWLFTCLLYACSEQAYDRNYYSRFISRRTRNDDSRVASPPASARIRAGAAHPAAIQRPAASGRGFAL